MEVFGSLKADQELSAELKQVHKELEHYADLIGKADEIADNLSKLESRRAELEEGSGAAEGRQGLAARRAFGRRCGSTAARCFAWQGWRSVYQLTTGCFCCDSVRGARDSACATARLRQCRSRQAARADG